MSGDAPYSAVVERAVAFAEALAEYLESPAASTQWAAIMTASPGWADTVEPLHRYSARERAAIMVAAEREHLDDCWIFALTRQAQRALRAVIDDNSWSAPILERRSTLEPRGLMYFHRPVAFDVTVPIVAATWGPVPAGGAGVHVTGWGQVPPGADLPMPGGHQLGPLVPCVDATIGVLPAAVDRRLMAGAELAHPSTRFLRATTAAWYGVKTEALSVVAITPEGGPNVAVTDEAADVDAHDTITAFMNELWLMIEHGGGPLPGVDGLGQ